MQELGERRDGIHRRVPGKYKNLNYEELDFACTREVNIKVESENRALEDS